jgi:hypothetical protein
MNRGGVMNPFKANGHILPIASINSVYVEDKLAIDIFRPQLLIEAILEKRKELMISDDVTFERILYVFNECLSSDIIQVRDVANAIAKEFGERLASVILTLKKPSAISMGNRIDWTLSHWDFWKRVEKIYFVGGLTSPILTNIFYQEIIKALNREEVNNFSVSFIEGSSNLGTQGLATLVENGEYLIFDFGQTNIKRRHFIKQKNEVIIDLILNSVKSDYLFYKNKTEQDIKTIATELDQYIQDVILNTIREVNFKGETILISIANYVNSGMIYSARGGYGKLAYISNNYQKHLECTLSDKIGSMVTVQLYHDTSAMALNFRNEKCSSVISLGTAFGVAFPE